MDITYLEEQATALKEIANNYDYSTPEDRFIRTHLQTTINKITGKISEIKMDDFYNDRIQSMDGFDGNVYIIPPFMSNHGDEKKVCIVDNSVMVIPHEVKFDKDGSFHVYMYVYLKLEEDKHVKVCVRLLGNDAYGDRIYVSAYYYKKLGSFSSYYSKDYAKNSMPSTYKDSVHKVVNRFRQFEGFENFNPKVKW